MESDWTATDAPTYTKGKFTNLSDSATTLGLHAKPGKLVLDPIDFELYSCVGETVKTLLEDKKSDEKVVFIKADQGVDYGVVMATMDQLRAAGIEDMGLITEKPAGSAAGAGGQQ